MNNAHLFKDIANAPFVFVAMPFFGVKDIANKTIAAEERIRTDIEQLRMKHHIQQLRPEMTISLNDFDVQYRKNSKVSKGSTVSHALNLAKTQKKEYDPAGTMPFYFVCCDGKGAIPYSYVGVLAKQLRDGDVNCIFANRGREKGISKPRYDIERFEMFIATGGDMDKLARIDGQCGLWGFNVSECPDITLTSTGYEIELEFFLKAHRSKCTRIGTVGVEVSPSAETSFIESYSEGSSHYQKAYYLMGELGLSNSDLLSKIEPFEKQTGIKLGREYVEMIRSMSAPQRDLLDKSIKDVTPQKD